MSDEPSGQVLEDEDELDAEREARRRIALAQIRQYPDPALRLTANPVEEIDDDLRRLIERMKTLMVEARGVGLAATQVGVIRRLFVFQLPDEDEVRPVINPELVEQGEELVSEDEGCLSLQRVLVPVERHLTVTLVGRDDTGNDLRLELDGHAARVAQHELDHLDGVLIIDRTTDEARREALATLRPQPVLGLR
jgi:peptide deformylase